MAIGRPIELTPNIATKNISSLATDSQTQFTVTGGYRINEIAVYRNGVRLAEGRDFTASDGDTVNLVTAAEVDDVIEFAVFDSFNISDAIVSAASTQTLNGDFNITGNLYAGTFRPDALVATAGTVSSILHVGTALTADAAGNLNTVGVVTASSFSGDGSALTGLANTDYIVSVATTTGDLKVGAAVTVGGIVNIDATTDSTSTTTGALIVDGGLGVAKNVYIGAGLSVAGTLTYEDVTSVDSVGLITAKSGVNITGGELTVGSGITMGIAGVATFSGTSDVHLLDNVKLNVGDSNDFQVSHDGSNTLLNNTSGHLQILSDQTISFRDSGLNEVFAVFNDNGSVDLYHDNNKKFETTNDGTVTTGISTATGVDVTSNLIVGSGITMGSAGVATFSGTADIHLHDGVRLLLGTGSDLRITHDGSHAYIQENTGNLRIDADTLQLRSSAGENYLYGAADGAVTLYHDSSAKLATSATGITVTGNATATKFLGDGSSLTGVGGDMDITSCLFV